MKNGTRKLVAGTLTAAALVGGALAANGVMKTLEAHYVGVKLVVNGIQVETKDGNGNSVEPFIVNGTTYLPVRTVAEALDQEVQWDGATKTVYIGDNIPGSTINWMKELPPYNVEMTKIFDGSNPKEYFTVSGVKHPQGLTMQDHYNGFVHHVSALWNTNCQYRTMTFTVGHLDGEDSHDAPLDIYLDGTFKDHYRLEWDGSPKTITVDLNYAPNVKLVLNDNGDDYTSMDVGFGIYDISFQE